MRENIQTNFGKLLNKENILSEYTIYLRNTKRRIDLCKNEIIKNIYLYTVDEIKELELFFESIENIIPREISINEPTFIIYAYAKGRSKKLKEINYALTFVEDGLRKTEKNSKKLKKSLL